MGVLIFIIYLVAIIVVFGRRGALAGCFSIPLALIAGTWIGISATFGADFSSYIFPLVMTGGLAAMIFVPTEQDAARKAAKASGADQGSTWQNKPVAPILASSEGQVWQPSVAEAPKAWLDGEPTAATEIVEVDRSEYLPETEDAGDLAARKLDEDYENGVIDRATYVAERKKLAQ